MQNTLAQVDLDKFGRSQSEVHIESDSAVDEEKRRQTEKELQENERKGRKLLESVQRAPLVCVGVKLTFLK